MTVPRRRSAAVSPRTRTPTTRPGVFSRLAKDESATLLSMELILTATLISLGAVVGLSSLRAALSQEFGDVSAGLASIDQGYGVTAISSVAAIDNVSFDLFLSASNYTDLPNFGEPADFDPGGGEPMCINVTAAIDDERAVP